MDAEVGAGDPKIRAALTLPSRSPFWLRRWHACKVTMAKDVMCQVSWRHRGRREGVTFGESVKASWGAAASVAVELCEIEDKAKGLGPEGALVPQSLTGGEAEQRDVGPHCEAPQVLDQQVSIWILWAASQRL